MALLSCSSRAHPAILQRISCPQQHCCKEADGSLPECVAVPGEATGFSTNGANQELDESNGPMLKAVDPALPAPAPGYPERTGQVATSERRGVLWAKGRRDSSWICLAVPRPAQ